MDLKKIMEKIAKEAMDGMELAIKNLHSKDKVSADKLAHLHNISTNIADLLIKQIEAEGLDDDEAAVVFSGVLNLLSKTYELYLDNKNIELPDEEDEENIEGHINEESISPTNVPEYMYM